MYQGMLLSGLCAFGLTAILIFALRPVAFRIDLVDHPGGRKTHGCPTPLVGGIAMVTAFAFSTLTLDISLSEYRMLFAGALVLLVVGTLDDLHELSPTHRFGAQIIAGLLMTLPGGVVLYDLGYLIQPNDLLALGSLSVPVTVFALVGVINAVNMLDGVDGLAASLVLIVTASLVAIAFTGGKIDVVSLLWLFGAVILSFLLFNLRFKGRALVFMGDAGSMFLGFVLTWFLIELAQGENRLMAPVTALWLLALPLVDTVSIMARRMLLGRSPFMADRRHFHHILLAAGFTAKQTLALMALMAITYVGIGLAGHFLGIAEHWMFLGFLTLFALHFWMTARAWRVKRFLTRPLTQNVD